MFFLLSFIFSIDIIINADTYDVPFDIKDAVHTSAYTYVLTTDNRVMTFKGAELQNSFSVSNPISDKPSRAVSLLWIDEDRSLWVNDITQQQVRIYQNQQLTKTIKNIKVREMIRNDDIILLISPSDIDPMLFFDLKGSIIKESNYDTFPDANPYHTKASSRNFTVLSNDQLAFSYIYFNKIGLINLARDTIEYREMSPFYNLHWNGSTPYFRSTAGISSDAEGNVLLLTCEYQSRSCVKFILYNIDKNQIIGHAVSPEPIFRFKKQRDGLFVIVYSNFSKAQISSHLPFKMNYKSTP